MVEILQNKNAATRFQILVEIAASGPDIQQKSIAARLGVTPQAISNYIQQLIEDDLIVSTGRSHYRLGTKGVNWMLKELRELRSYSSQVEQAVTSITACAAIAESDIKRDQTVGLKMKDGLLYAGSRIDGSARGIALSHAKRGEDVDISNIEGHIEFTKGRITILQVPVIQKGGSRQIDPDLLKERASGDRQIGAIGIEALTALRRLDIEPRYLYGVTEAAVEAARCGLSFTIVCTEDTIPELIKKIRDEGLNYELLNLHRNAG